MKDCATIEIDCERGVVSVNSDNTTQYNLAGNVAIKSSRALLISECLCPQIRDLMGLPMDELKRRSLAAMGVTK